MNQEGFIAMDSRDSTPEGDQLVNLHFFFHIEEKKLPNLGSNVQIFMITIFCGLNF